MGDGETADPAAKTKCLEERELRCRGHQQVGCQRRIPAEVLCAQGIETHRHGLPSSERLRPISTCEL